MILTKDYLTQMCYNFKVKLTDELEKELLETYGKAPDERHVWSEQDIYEQVRKALIKYYKL